MLGLACPVCSQQLSLGADGRSLGCSNGHNFDLARQGYANLLLSQNKKSRSPGDSAEMVAARTDFLDLGYYNQFSEFLCEHISDLFASRPIETAKKEEVFSILDVGCGEGFYTTQIAKNLRQIGETICTGIDISVPAIKACCKRSRSDCDCPNIQWLVASANHLPIERHSQDLICFLFCRVVLSEAKDKLKPGGSLVIVSTGPDHLIEMRELLYDDVKESKAYSLDPVSDWKLKSHTKFQDTITISKEADMRSLLVMTPHVWRSKPDKQALLCQDLPRTLSIDIDIKVLDL